MSQCGYDNDRTTATQHAYTMRTWIIQLHPPQVDYLVDLWREGDCVYTPAVDRHLLDVRVGDVVLFWVTGRKGQAGVFGGGRVTNSLLETEHHRDYADPDSPIVVRTSIEVRPEFVKDWVMVTRPELQALEGFSRDEFELFKMPRRPNAFAVSPEQHEVIFSLLMRLAEGGGRR